MRVSFRAGQTRKADWRGDAAVPQFRFKVKWAMPTVSGARECWRVSFSARHKNITVDTRKPRARLKLVG